jgi:galactokinase
VDTTHGNWEKALQGLYGRAPAALEAQAARWSRLLAGFAASFPDAGKPRLFSVPGRTEVGGNHTDHNAGRVLAAAVDLDVIAAACAAKDGAIVVESEGYPVQHVDLHDLRPVGQERFTAAALTRGVAARMRELGRTVGGARLRITSAVLKGSGLSSSAAYEVAVAAVLNHLYNGGEIPDIEIAQTARYAENVYFGKPCGLMDQTSCAVGGFVTIDFADAARPVVRKVDVDFRASGYGLVIVDTGGSHADLNEEYAAVAGEMRAVAQALGGTLLRDVTREAVLAETPRLRGLVGDRALLRALHYFDDNERVLAQVSALEAGDFPRFLDLVVQSGLSSWTLLQNCYPPAVPREQGVSLALAVSRRMLEGRGAWRVHGGGFAGTIQAFVPADLLAPYAREMRRIFGPRACLELSIRSAGAVELSS